MVQATDLPREIDFQFSPLSSRTATDPEYRYMLVVFYDEKGRFLCEGVVDQAILNKLSETLPIGETVYFTRGVDMAHEQKATLGKHVDVPSNEIERLSQYFVRRGFIGALNHKRRYGKHPSIERSGCTFRVVQSNA